MKVAVCSMGDNLDSPTDPRFGRCAYFVIVDTETMQSEAVSNTAATTGQGAGIMAAIDGKRSLLRSKTCSLSRRIPCV